jgi:hypothetical protein
MAITRRVGRDISRASGTHSCKQKDQQQKYAARRLGASSPCPGKNSCPGKN